MSTGIIVSNRTVYGGGANELVRMTLVEYEALPDTKYTDGKYYFISDATGEEEGFEQSSASVLYREGESVRDAIDGIEEENRTLAQQTEALKADVAELRNYKLAYIDEVVPDSIEVQQHGFYTVTRTFDSISPVFATIANWRSNTGAFSVGGPVNENGNTYVYVIASPGTVIEGLRIRFWYYAD